MSEVKPFAAFDVDGTIFKSSLLEKIVQECIDAKVFQAEPFNAAYENRQRWQLSNSEGIYQAYLNRLIKAFTEQMAGVPVEELANATDSMLNKNRARTLSFPRKLLREIKDSHYSIALSGSPETLVKPFLEGFGFEEAHGTIYEVENERFTGDYKVIGDKARRLAEMVGSGAVALSQSIAVGDTQGDISMLEFADRPVIFNATRTLTHYGREFGWPRVMEVKDQITVLERDSSGHYTEADLGDFLISLRHIE